MANQRPDAESLIAAFASSDFSRDEHSWAQAVRDARGGDDLSVPEADAQGNYTSPLQTRILATLAAYDAGKVEADDVMAVLDRAEDVVGNMLALAQASEEQGLSDPSNPISQATRSGFEQHSEALAALRRLIEDKGPDTRKSVIALLQNATNELVENYANFQRLRLASMTVLCPTCGAQNRSGCVKCVACSNPLPAAIQAQESRLLAVAAEGVLQAEVVVPIKTPNYERIERTLAAWESGDMDDEAFEAEVRAVRCNMQSHREANEAERADLAELTEDEQQVMLSLLDSVDEALDANLQALDKMLGFFASKDPKALKSGFDDFATATRQIVEAYMASQALIHAGDDDEE